MFFIKKILEKPNENRHPHIDANQFYSRWEHVQKGSSQQHPGTKANKAMEMGDLPLPQQRNGSPNECAHKNEGTEYKQWHHRSHRCSLYFFAA